MLAPGPDLVPDAAERRYRGHDHGHAMLTQKLGQKADAADVQIPVFL
jgi:hypothetical protein